MERERPSLFLGRHLCFLSLNYMKVVLLRDFVLIGHGDLLFGYRCQCFGRKCWLKLYSSSCSLKTEATGWNEILVPVSQLQALHLGRLAFSR